MSMTEKATLQTPTQKSGSAAEQSLLPSNFLAAVSHEMRTPLNGIIGMATLLSDTRLTGEQRAYTQALLQSGETLLALVEDLLDVSRIESGQFTLRPVETEIVPFCENITELMALGTYAKHLSIGCHVAPEVPLRVDIDAERVRQILYNLIGNAVKFTTTGGILLHVTHEDGAISFRVTDTGSGLKPEHSELIFQAFEQANASNSEKIQGAGLGLTISRQLTAAIGGTLAVESEYGVGSSFILRLPIKENSHSLELRCSGKHYLIAGYAQQECKALALTLRGEGAQVDLVADAAELYGALNQCSFDAVLIAARIFENLPTQLSQSTKNNSPMIVLLDPHQKPDLTNMLQRGFDRFLMRPVRRSSLFRVLAETGNATDPKIIKGDIILEPGVRFLVADDNVINRHLTCSLLKKAGHEAISVCDGVSALKLLLAPEHSDFDILLLDVQMPLLDGPGVLTAIRAHEEAHGGAALPIIILSADPHPHTRKDLLALGANDFILKPAVANTILTIAARHLARVKPAAEIETGT